MFKIPELCHPEDGIIHSVQADGETVPSVVLILFKCALPRSQFTLRYILIKQFETSKA